MSDDRLIVALDVPMLLAAFELGKKLGRYGELFTKSIGNAEGGAWRWQMSSSKSNGKRIFLDMKLF